MYSCSAPATEYEIEMYKKEIATVNRRWELAVSAFQSTGADQENKPAESAAYRLYKQNTIDLFVLPKFFEIKNNLENMTIANDALKKTHDYYIKTCLDMINFYVLISEYLKTHEHSKLELANVSLDSAGKNLVRYKEKFREICR